MSKSSEELGQGEYDGSEGISQRHKLGCCCSDCFAKLRAQRKGGLTDAAARPDMFWMTFWLSQIVFCLQTKEKKRLRGKGGSMGFLLCSFGS